ncbi:MAG: GntR family transcriptional regulator [Mesorhizobium sp.]|nr:GntR family transcriptional regulator [Mesorhizobium sp. M5C.F.Ca.IN.020.14.1.1]RWI36168.1 MAG: GntR family transcriptional regulator [Mesorhizobium sp.]RWI63660.1 MAG: GntR family transcriptional regulator [Mesorhizobium sp.]RWJ22862.1 MAG: GntR family transcriptional regulator [Mesorhizobium sp.]TIQ70114.1 MAG: GntR family transcriptional regulator [Mesorhizobium sp.]
MQLRGASSLHESVREELLKRIKSGTYLPGAAIPSTSMLSGEFGVSPITIKRALRDLQNAGVLIAVAGKGTFVKEQRRFLRELDVWLSSMDNARRLGFTPSMRLLSITREKISDPAMSVFNPPAEAMLCVRKTIYADDLPIMYDATYLSSDVDDDIVEEFGERFVTDALERHAIDIVNTRIVIDAAPAAGKAEDIFAVPNGFPMLRRLYKVTTTVPTIAIFGVVESPFDRLACSITIPSDLKSKDSTKNKE